MLQVFGIHHFEPFFGIDTLVYISADIAVREFLLQFHLLMLTPVASSFGHFNLLVVVMRDASSWRGCFHSSWGSASSLGCPDAATDLFHGV